MGSTEPPEPPLAPTLTFCKGNLVGYQKRVRSIKKREIGT